MTADQDCLDLFLMQSLELLSHVSSSRVAGQYTVIEVASYQEEVWPVLKSKIDQNIEAVLKVSLSLEPSRTVLYCRGVEMVVGREKDVNSHYPLSYHATRTERLLRALGSILNLEAVEPEAFQAVTPSHHPRFQHGNIPFL